MKNKKILGVWMDYSTANLYELSSIEMKKHVIQSDFNYGDKMESLTRSEFTMHRKEQQKQEEYFHQIGVFIKPFTDVLLFGPTNAKVELINLLRKDHLFDEIKIDVINTDKMNDVQQSAFLKSHFAKI
jgi:hypothetical protein